MVREKELCQPYNRNFKLTATPDGKFAFSNSNGDVLTTLDFVDGNTYVFDLSSPALADSTFGAGSGNPVSIGLSTGADGAGTKLTDGVPVTGVPGTDGATLTYVHAGSATAGETIHIYGVDTSADSVISGMQATGITTTQSAPVAVVSVVDNMGTSGTGSGVTITDEVREIQASTETHPWGTETTYFFAGAVIGSSEIHGSTGSATDGATGSREVFYDATGNRIGEVYSDEYGSGSNFRLKLTAPVDIDGDGTNDFGTFAGNSTNETYFLETSSNTYTDTATNTSQTSESSYYYGVDSSNPNEPDWSTMLGGSEVYDGVETRYGANWESLGQTLSVDLAAAAGDSANTGITVLDQAAKDALPSALVAPSGETYAQVEAMPGDSGNTETTYYDANGKILGYSSTTISEMPGHDGTPQQSSNTSYKNANREFIGGSFTDSYGTGFNTSETVTIDDAVDIDFDGENGADITITASSYPSSYRVESGGFTPTNANESASTNTHYFSATGEHLGGIDTYGAQTTIYGANWTVTSTSTDTSKLTLEAVDTNLVSSDFLDAVAPNAGPATVTIAVTVNDPTGTPTFYFDGAAIPSDFSINEGDTYIFDTSHASMDGFEIGFSTVANSESDALTTGVSVNGIPGTTGASTTLILPVEYGGVNGSGGQELHIFGKQATMVEVPGPQAPAPSVTLVTGDIDLYVQTDTNGDALGGVLTNTNPGWGQAGSAATISHASAGEVIHVQNLNYQGMEMVSTDVSGKTSMHIDLWAENSGAVKFFLVATGGGSEAGIVLDVTGGQWNSFDIDLAAFGSVASGEIFQLKLDAQSGAIGTKTPLTDFYMDNLYFGDQTPTIGTPIAAVVTDVTLDFNTTADVNPDWAFGGATAAQATHEGAEVLSFTHPATGAEAWAGATIAVGYGETDYIPDRGSVTMRVWSENAGTVTLAMEDTSSIPANAGATRYITDTQSVTGGGWDDVTFTFPASNAVGTESGTNYNQLVIKTDVGNTVHVDEIGITGAEVVTEPENTTPSDSGSSVPISTVTLDFNETADVNPDWAFGGATAAQATHEGAEVLSFTHPATGAEAWAGATIAVGYGETDYIADRGSVTMRIWSENSGTVTLAMEDTSSIPANAGATRYITDTQSVTDGVWNEVTFTFPASNAVGTESGTNYNQLVIKTDVGNTVHVDEIVMNGAEVHVASTPATEEVVSVVDNMGTSGTGSGVVITDEVREIQTSTETHPWGTETTYFFAGAVIGSSEIHGSTGSATDGATGSREVFYDATGNRIGEVYSDEYGSGSNFSLKLTAPVDIDGDGTNDFGTFAGNSTNETYFLVTSSETYTDTATNTSQTSESSYYYGVDSSNPNEPDLGTMLGGSAVYDGVETRYGANWESLGQTLSVDLSTAVGDPNSGYVVLTTAQKDSLPSALVATGGSETYAFDEVRASGELKTTYYNDGGTILGTGIRMGDATNDPSAYVSTNYKDSDQLNLGNSWQDQSGSGFRFITRGTDTDDGEITGVSAADNSGSPVNYRIENAGFTPSAGHGATGETDTEMEGFSEELIFNDDTNILIKGTRIEGSTTTVYGNNYQIDSVTTSVDNLSPVDTSLLEPKFVAAVLAEHTANGAVVFSSDKPLGAGTETTYFNASGEVIGYISQDSYTSGAAMGSSTSYFDEQNFMLGRKDVNQDGSNFWFEVKLTADDGTVTWQRTGSEEWLLNGSPDQTRNYEFNYSHNSTTNMMGDFLSGEETVTDYNLSATGPVTTKTVYGPDGHGGREIIGVYDGDGNVLDPYVMFDLPNWTVPSESLLNYATASGYADPNAQVLVDQNGDGTPDLLAQFRQELVDHLLFSTAQEQPILDSGDNSLLGFNVSEAPYSIDVLGSFTLNGDGEPNGGTITEMHVYTYDGTTKGTTAIAYNDALQISWADFAQILPSNEQQGPSPDTAAVFTFDANDAVVFADQAVNVTNLDPDWGQATDLQEITDTEAGEVLKFSNFNYQGIELVEQDLSGKEHLHLDVWSATTGAIKVGPVSASTGEHLIEFNVTGGQWNAIDLDMADFAAAGKALTDIFQIKFDTGSTPVSEFYVDNLAFTGTATSTTPVVVAGPDAPAPSVTLVTGDIDLYVQTDTNGDALGGVLTNTNPGWGQAGSAATISHASAGEVIHVQNLNYQGMEMVSTDVSGKTSMHIDLWAENSGAVKFFLVATGGGSEAGIVLDVTGGQWNSFDIDLAAFGSVASGEIFQLKLDAQPGAIGTKTPLTDFYMDNLYFGDQTPTIGTPSTGGNAGGSTTDYYETVVQHHGTADALSEAKLTISKTGNDQITITIESNNADPVDFVTIGAQEGVAAGLSAMTLSNGVASIDMFWNAGQMPSAASFEVLWSKESTDGNWMLRKEDLGVIDTGYTVGSGGNTGDGNTGGGDTVLTSPDAPAPSVTLVTGDIDLYVQTDTNGDALGGVLTNTNPGWGQAGSAATISHASAGEVIHVQNLNYQGMEMVSTDVSGKTSMHIDLWAENSGAVKFFLVATGGGSEAGIVLDVTGGQWNSFDIDLAAFGSVASGEIFQLKLDAQPGAIGTKTPLTDFYMDNLYFGDQTPTIGTPIAAVVTDVTLDFNTTADVNPDWAFGGATVAQATHEGAQVLSFTHPATGAEAWAGATIAVGYGETDYIPDRGSVTMRVWSENAGTVTLAMEDTSSIPANAGATRYITDTECDWWWLGRCDVYVPCFERGGH